MEENSVIEKFNINDEVTLNLKEWFLFLCGKAVIIVIAIIAGGLIAFIATKLFISPEYTSKTQVYVMAKQDPDSNVTFNDLELSSQLSSDYIQFALSRPVLEQVIDQLNLKYSVEQLQSIISMDTAANARILNISVRNISPESAKQIADTVRDAANHRFNEIVGIDSVTTLEEANLPSVPSSPKLSVNMAIGIVIAFIIICSILTLIYIRDDTLKTPDDIEYHLSLNVLASIPVLDKTSGSSTASRRNRSRSSRKRIH